MGKLARSCSFLRKMLSWTQRFRSRLWGLIGAYSASITEIVGHLVNVSHGTSIDIGEKNLWTVGNLVVRFWYPSLVLVEFMSLPEIIAHRDACKRSEIIVVIAIVFTFFSISHHHHQNHHFFLKFIPPHGTTTLRCHEAVSISRLRCGASLSRPDCFENAKSRLSIGVTTFTPLPGCLVAEAYLQPAVVLSGRFFHFVSYFSHVDFRRSLVAQMSLWQPCLLLRWGWHDGNVLGPKMVHFAKDRCTSLRIREMMKQHSRIQIAKCDLLRFWRMKYLEMLADRKDFVSSIGPFLVAQRLGSCYIPVAFEARWHTWTSWYHDWPAWSSILCQSRSCVRWHFLAMFVWEVPQWSSNHGNGLKEVRSVVEWKISIDILFMPIQHQEILKLCTSERFRVSLRNLEVDRLWFQQLKFPKLHFSASSEGLYGMEEFASSPAQGDVVVSPPLGFFGSWGKQCASSGPLVFLCFSHVVIV